MIINIIISEKTEECGFVLKGIYSNLCKIVHVNFNNQKRTI